MMACSVVKLSPYCTSHFLVGRIMCASTRGFQWGPKALNNPSAVRQLYLPVNAMSGWVLWCESYERVWVFFTSFK
jgi:hypothetical protein